MVSSEKTALVWSLNIFIFIIGATSYEVIDFSTKQISIEGETVTETTKVDDVPSDKLPELSDIYCSWSHFCFNGGICTYEGLNKKCQCKNGTSGVHCEIIDECESNPTKCGIEPDAKCIYNISKETADCKCTDASKGFDSYKKKCRVPCKTSNDCSEYLKCRKNRDNDLRFCNCPFGLGGDKCNEEFDECKAVGLDCGNNPNVTCVKNGTGNAACYCDPWYQAYNYEVKDCVECNCEIANLGCQFFPGGEKQCYCQNDYYQKDGKCVDCDCGAFSSGCKSVNGTKVCNCWKKYLQNNDKCEECDCGENSIKCSFENGQKTCSCKPGYIESDGICRKICYYWAPYDACQNGGKCENRVCQCLSGTHGDRCEIIKGCENTWDRSYKCGYSDGVDCAFNQTSLEPYCKCQVKDYLFDNYDKKCKECDCGIHGSCSYVRGDKTCKCEPGYAKNPRGWFEESVCSPCDCGQHSTDCKFKYRDTIECTCESGYVQLNDECAECDCGPNGDCTVDEFNNKVCTCYYGYEDNNGHCDFCDCGGAGECSFDHYGRKTCNCRAGYGDKDGICSECSCYWYGDYSRYDYINCTFRFGEETCTCPDGYKEQFDGYCVDIDECKDPFSCPSTTYCTNTPGSFTCTCKKGYRQFNDRHDTKLYDCIDINECYELNECPYRDTSECVNTQGSYYCKCKSGYYSNTQSSATIEKQGCQKDQTGWRIGYIILIVVFCIIAFGLIIAICKRRSSS